MTIHYNLIPTQPITYGQGLRFAVSIDDAPPQLVTIKAGTGAEVGSSAAWSAQCFGQHTTATTTTATIPAAGAHTLKIYMVDPGVLLEKIVIDNGGLRPSYLARRRLAWRRKNKCRGLDGKNHFLYYSHLHSPRSNLN